MVPQNTCLHSLWVSAKGEVSKGRKWVSGIRKNQRAHFFENQGFPFLGLSHLFVTSIWMVKLERKTRKVQAA